jgi:hypothetical protein
MTSTMVAVTGPAPASQINNMTMIEVDHPPQSQFLMTSGPAGPPLNPPTLPFNHGPQIHSPAMYPGNSRLPPSLAFLSPQVQPQSSPMHLATLPQGQVFPPSPTPPLKKTFSPNDIKMMLQNQLKGDFPRYWDLLKQFIAGKLTKPEFDMELKKFFPERLIPTHNMLILNILRATYTSYYSNLQAKRRYPSRGQQSRLYPYYRRGTVDTTGRREQRTLQEYRAMKNRLERTAKTLGLTAVQPDCIPFMLTALDHVLAAFVYKPETTLARHLAAAAAVVNATTLSPTSSTSSSPAVVTTPHINGLSLLQLPRNIRLLPTPVDTFTNYTSASSDDRTYEDSDDNVAENYRPQEHRFTSPRMYHVPSMYLNNPSSLAPVPLDATSRLSSTFPQSQDVTLIHTNVPNLVTKRDVLLTVQKRPGLEKLGDNIVTLRDALTLSQN